jgi:hypothetical protein
MGAICFVGPLRLVFCTACGRHALGAEIRLGSSPLPAVPSTAPQKRCVDCLRAVAEQIRERLAELRPSLEEAMIAEGAGPPPIGAGGR